MNGGAVMRTTLAVLPFALRLARGAEPGISFDPSGAPVKIDEHFWARVERTADARLAVFVTVDKCGSSSVRELLWRRVTRACAAPCRRPFVVQAPFGACEHYAALARWRGRAAPPFACAYFTMLREPVAQAASSYAYFCRGCAERGRFCGRLAATRCPAGLPFLEWTRAFQNNLFTRLFASREWASRKGNASFYLAWASGFAASAPLTARDEARALAALRAPDMLLLWLEELRARPDVLLRKLEAFLGDDARGAETAARAEAAAAPHENAIAEGRSYVPTPAEREAARRILEFDARIHALLGFRPNSSGVT